MPILKQLVSNSAHSKRRSRADLTAEMISAPLGDFRHTMHVGRAGDAFGDTSFLNSKAGEPESPEELGSSKPGLLSCKFRSSKRSQSVTRGDRRDMLGSLRDSAIFVKNAVSLPQLTEKEVDKSAGKLPKSLSSSPVKKAPEEEAAAPEEKPHPNGAAARPQSPGLDERDFGDLTDLPVVVPKSSYGMKHAESIMSFHIDLGPSMLGDVLSIMDKDQWDQDEDFGAMVPEELRRDGGPTRVPAAHRLSQEGKSLPDSLLTAPACQDQSRAMGCSLGFARSQVSRDSSSVSSCTAQGLEECPPSPERQSYGIPAGARPGPPKQHDREFSFADEEDDEIRV
ncbi:geminin coiled-coil domain-containing protein 1 [Platysternon megacephalum]|uniref:Geminin coiled-coil domain-containing protein 1 n=1 Tax=Platysternon megacephalum TaxID=55544 RepID=A0A4D9E6A2_9SAUR|nr:geminin coiled-coil domain-containing protein 1 [Platysternon megacephalum]